MRLSALSGAKAASAASGPSSSASAMARLSATAPVRWWQVLGGWARGGLVAAAAVLVIVTMLLSQNHREEVWTVYDEVMHPVAEPLPIPSGVLSGWDGLETRGETFRDVISR